MEMVPLTYWPACRTTYLRSQSWKSGVCETIRASAMMPTSSVPTSAMTCSVRRRYFFAGVIRLCNIPSAFRLPSERLADGKGHPEPPGLRLAVHEQARNGIALVAGVEAKRADRRPGRLAR